LSCIASSNRGERTNIVAYVRWCERRTRTLAILVGAVYWIGPTFNIHKI